MNYSQISKKIEKNELTAAEGLNKLYPVKYSKAGKRAHFVKVSVQIPEESNKLNTFLRILFAIPFPLIFARIGLRIGGRFIKADEFDPKMISHLIKYSKGTTIQVESKDAKIDIRIV